MMISGDLEFEMPESISSTLIYLVPIVNHVCDYETFGIKYMAMSVFSLDYSARPHYASSFL